MGRQSSIYQALWEQMWGHTKYSQRWSLLKVRFFLVLASAVAGQEPVLIKSAAVKTKSVCSESTTKMTPSGDAIHRRHTLCCPRNAAQLRGKWTCILTGVPGPCVQMMLCPMNHRKTAPLSAVAFFCLLVGLPYAMAHCLTYPTVAFLPLQGQVLFLPGKNWNQ